jgi:predicted RNase H-like nuclease (RuvC/YqgF family)
MDYETERILRDILDRLENLEKHVYGTRREEGLKGYIDRELSNLYERLSNLQYELQKIKEELRQTEYTLRQTIRYGEWP